jgi:hypothetical protein
MRTIQSVVLPVVVAASVLWLGEAMAQQAETPMPAAVVEIFACKFNNGKGMDDMLAVTRRFNTWADQNGVTDYTAVIMTPYFYSPDVDYDVLWVGAWPNGTAMGADETKWLATGGQVQAAFDSVGPCASHAGFAAVPVRTPPGQGSGNAVALFEDCKIREGRTPGEAITAQREWSEYMAGRGHDGFSAVLFPLAGQTADWDYTFKNVHVFDSVAELGKATDLYTTGGVQRQNQLLGRITDCNSPRLYRTNRVRQAAEQAR